MPPKKKNYRNNKKKTKTSFTRKKIRNGVPAAVMAAETKIQKTILDFQNVNPALFGSQWFTPYMNFTPEAELTSIWDPAIYAPDVPNNIYDNIGSFILNGDDRDQRNGRRITMLTSIVDMVFHLRAIPVGDPETFTYSANPEFRIVHGWVKGGIDSLRELSNDITSLYSEIPYARYMIKSDRVVSRRAQAGLNGTPSLAVTYSPFKYHFTWKPNKRITFDKSTHPDGGGPAASDTRYDGWVPFIYIFNPHSNLELVFDNMKRVNIFKDL